MKIKLHIHTFPKGQTQGSCVPVANVSVELELSEQQIIKSEVCGGSELVTQLVPTVTILGRKFIVSPTSFNNVTDYTIGVTQEFAQLVKENLSPLNCPCCGSTQTQTVPQGVYNPFTGCKTVYELDYGFFLGDKAFPKLETITKHHGDFSFKVVKASWSLIYFVRREIELGRMKWVQ
jgi:hypothetical protein